MKKSFIFLTLAVFLASCTTSCGKSDSSDEGTSSGTNTSQIPSASIGDSSINDSTVSVTNPSNSNDSTAPITVPNSSSNSDSTISIPDSTSTGESSNTTTPDPAKTTVADVRQLATTVAPLTEIARKDINYTTYAGPSVTIEAKFLAVIVDNNHILLQVSDGTESIGIVMERTVFDKSGLHHKTGDRYTLIGNCYKFTGKVSTYLGRPEIIYVSHTASSLNPDIDLTPIAPVKTIGEVHDMITTLEINDKGNAFSSLVTIEAQYVANAEDAVMMFYDGSHVIQIHGNNYINNGRDIGETWKLVVSIGRFQYKPSLEYISGVRTEGVKEVIYNNPIPITSAELRAKKIENLDVYPHLYSFRGYVNAYIKGGTNYYLGLVDKVGDRAHDVATSQPNLSIRLNNHSNLYGRDLDYSVFVPYYIKDEIVETIFAIYMYNGGNTIKTWQVHAFDETVIPLYED